ncbi:hypothetical protein J0H58_22205, partial [bacterium]|nr:hypothetical protein [bacterium]
MTEPTAPRRGWLRGTVRAVATAAMFGGLAAGAAATRAHWLPVLFPAAAEKADDDHDDHGPVVAGERVILSEQAQKNLRLTSAPLTAGPFWKEVTLPGMIVD